MAVTTTAPAPYAPPSAVLEVINRHRARGLPAPITQEVLGRAGISESLIPRTLQALQSLDLINENGMPSPTLEGLRLAPEHEFKARIAEWLNGAYADVLQFIDPATASDTDVRDAFRSYNPIGQQGRMVTLFQGLYAAAGIGSERQSAPRPAARTAPPKPRAQNAPRNKRRENQLRTEAQHLRCRLRSLDYSTAFQTQRKDGLRMSETNSSTRSARCWTSAFPSSAAEFPTMPNEPLSEILTGLGLHPVPASRRREGVRVAGAKASAAHSTTR
ncbi:MAG: DUF5343 domain-containing protein [Hyphomonadaceae bacterium JAD_PAG50586_4]|nr:MAG: DUF5343 domain-containing protein [Hyphomonadaceae bacterium JAD_PAG50586_4]